MFTAGDELGRTQRGNNNAYCQDNEISWLNWHMTKENSNLLRFFRYLIALRKNHPVFRRDDFFPGPDAPGLKAITWQSGRPGRQDWSATEKTLTFFLNGRGSTPPDDDFFVVLNSHRHTAESFIPPALQDNRQWLRIIDTAAKPPADIFPETKGRPIKPRSRITVRPMGAVVLISKPAKKTG